jgi:hypothetical protein
MVIYQQQCLKNILIFWKPEVFKLQVNDKIKAEKQGKQDDCFCPQPLFLILDKIL